MEDWTLFPESQEEGKDAHSSYFYLTLKDLEGRLERKKRRKGEKRKGKKERGGREEWKREGIEIGKKVVKLFIF